MVGPVASTLNDRQPDACALEVLGEVEVDEVRMAVERDPEQPDMLSVTLHEPQSAITPGQIAGFYDPTFTELLGGGYIEQHLVHRPFDPARRENLPNLYCEL